MYLLVRIFQRFTHSRIKKFRSQITEYLTKVPYLLPNLLKKARIESVTLTFTICRLYVATDKQVGTLVTNSRP